MSAQQPQPAPGVQVLSHAVLLQGESLASVAGLAELAMRTRMRPEGAASPRLERLVLALREAADAWRRACPTPDTPDVRRPAREAPSESTEPVTTEEVARMLGVSRRQAQRRMRGLGARMVRGSYVVDRGSVAALLAERRAA